MRAAVIRRSHVARPRRDTIALTIPKNAIWIGLCSLAAFAGLSFSIGLWVGRGTADQPAPVSTRVTLPALPALPAAPPPIAVEALVEPETPASPEPLPPAAPKIQLQLEDKLPKSKNGIQLGAFPSKAEAQHFLEKHAAHLEGVPIYILPAKVGSKGSKGVWYRVRVGSFDTAREAEGARAALPPDLEKGSMVVRYP